MMKLRLGDLRHHPTMEAGAQCRLIQGLGPTHGVRVWLTWAPGNYQVILMSATALVGSARCRRGAQAFHLPVPKGRIGGQREGIHGILTALPPQPRRPGCGLEAGEVYEQDTGEAPMVPP